MTDSRFRSFDVVDVHYVTGLVVNYFMLLRSGPINIIDIHLIPDKVRRSDGSLLDLLEIVSGVQGVSSDSLGRELDTVGP